MSLRGAGWAGVKGKRRGNRMHTEPLCIACGCRAIARNDMGVRRLLSSTILDQFYKHGRSRQLAGRAFRYKSSLCHHSRPSHAPGFSLQSLTRPPHHR